MSSIARSFVLGALLLAACSSDGGFPTAAPALPKPSAAMEIMLMATPPPDPSTGVITFGTSYDAVTHEITKPLIRFKRTYPRIVWRADLTRVVTSAYLTWSLVRLSESGVEETIFEVEKPIDDSTSTTLASSGALTIHVQQVAGTYVMRYLDRNEVLAEGVFTLVE